jgi:ribosome-associated protein
VPDRWTDVLFGASSLLLREAENMLAAEQRTRSLICSRQLRASATLATDACVIERQRRRTRSYTHPLAGVDGLRDHNDMTTDIEQDFELRDAFIPLDALLKAVGFVSSGGAAKAAVAAGQVRVDGQIETRKRCKIRAGQRVTFLGKSIRVIEARSSSE